MKKDLAHGGTDCEYRGGNDMKILSNLPYFSRACVRARRTAPLLIATLLAPLAMAGPIVPVPTSLASGASYRLLFVSVGTTTANMTNISSHNAFATAEANSVPELAALGSNWVIVGGTSALTALANMGSSTAPVYDLAGNLVGASMAAICAAGNISSHGPLNINQLGNTYSGNVWTGTSDSCGAQSRALGGNSSGEVRMGSTSASNTNWISVANGNRNTSLPIYVLSGELTSPVPEPGTVVLLGMGLGGLLLARRRR
jgi:hypothetical protein